MHGCSITNFLFQSDSIHFFTHHLSRTVNGKCKYGNKYSYLGPIVPIFLPLLHKWGLSFLYLRVSNSEMIFCDNAFSRFTVQLICLSSLILFSLMRSNRNLTKTILTFIMVLTSSVFPCFLKIHSHHDFILL